MWQAKTKLPVIRIFRKIRAGLTPISRGGGHQTHSRREKLQMAVEWNFRSVKNIPDVYIDPPLRENFAKRDPDRCPCLLRILTQHCSAVTADCFKTFHIHIHYWYSALIKQLGITKNGLSIPFAC